MCKGHACAYLAAAACFAAALQYFLFMYGVSSVVGSFLAAAPVNGTLGDPPCVLPDWTSLGRIGHAMVLPIYVVTVFGCGSIVFFVCKLRRSRDYTACTALCAIAYAGTATALMCATGVLFAGAMANAYPFYVSGIVGGVAFLMLTPLTCMVRNRGD